MHCCTDKGESDIVSMWTLGRPLSSLRGNQQFSIVSKEAHVSLFPFFLLGHLGAIIVSKWTPRSNYCLCLNT